MRAVWSSSSPPEAGELAAPRADQLVGLTEAAAAARLAEDGPNVLPASPRPTLLRRALRQAREPLSLLLVAASAISGVGLGHATEAIAILGIVLLNIAVGTMQEHRADVAIDALADMTAPSARVRRGGRTMVVPAAELVVDDVVEIAAGDRVPADVALAQAARFAVDEAVLTGESLPAEKTTGAWIEGVPLADQRGVAFAATMAVRGRAVGVVIATGANTAVGAIASSLTASTEPPLVGELRSVARRMSILAVLLGTAMVPFFAWRSGGDGIGEAVVAGVAMAVAAVPEGLATVVVTALALGARTMARRGAIVRTLPAIEALGSTTVLCTDKTGTLTTGELTVTDVVVAPEVAAGALWRAASRCTDAVSDTGDPVDVAIRRAAIAAGVDVSGADGRVDELPFDASTRAMETIHRVGGDMVLSVKGAPEVVLPRCTTGAARDAVEAALSPLLEVGTRVLVVAEAWAPDVRLGESGLTALGVIGFSDPLRSTTREAVAACRRAGIRIVMVTGDHARTASAIAADAGLETQPIVTGSTMLAADPESRASALRTAAVVARVDPVTKVDLVGAHRAAGEVVAMTGDGVNDAPALRRADVGIAIAGDAGTDVARAAADLVVTNGDLGTLAAAVREGRRIYRNLTSVVSYLLAGNVSEVMVVFGSLLLVPSLAVPFLPVQLLWVNLVTDGFPALALGVDHAPTDPLDGPPRRTSERLLDPRRLRLLLARAAAVATAVLATAAVTRALGWTQAETRAQLLLSLVVAHLVLAYVTRAEVWTFESGWWRNRTLAAAIGLSLAIQVPVFATPVGREVFGLAAVPWTAWPLASGAALAVVIGVDASRAMRRRLTGRSQGTIGPGEAADRGRTITT